MSTLQCACSIARAAIVVVLLSSRPADAQFFGDPGPPPHPGGVLNAWITGVKYDVVNQALAEKHLQHVQAKLRRDAERGHAAAVDHDVHKIDDLRYRIAMDEWLIRWNSLCDPGFYTIRTDCVSAAAIAQATHPIPSPYPPQLTPMVGSVVAAPTISITIVNAAPAGDSVAFAIDGVSHQAAAGSRQDLSVAPGSNITYDGGGSLGQRRYLLSQGRYEFRKTAEGWALYKLSGTP
jgi:hypothetical protein